MERKGRRIAEAKAEEREREREREREKEGEGRDGDKSIYEGDGRRGKLRIDRQTRPLRNAIAQLLLGELISPI